MVKIQNVDPAKLTPADYNPRTISEHQAEALKRSLDRWGFVEPIVANKRTGHIVGGHQRLDGALALALPSVPVHWIDVDESSEKALNIALNKISGDWDEDLLGKLLADLERDGQDLEDLGFDADELQEIIDAAAPEPELSGDLDEVPEPPAEPITQPGDLWQLGDHRLLCGDSTNADDVARLMGGETADMIYCDPPYGMNLDTDYSKIKGSDKSPSAKGYNWEKVVGDDKDFDPSPFLSVFKDTKEQFWWGADYYFEALPRGGSLLVWQKRDKADAEMIGNDFEICWSKQRHKKATFWHRWVGFDSVERGEKRVHPTQKPIALHSWVFEKWGNVGDLVVDVFLGSGSTLIAAEQTGRKCYAMEISPAYCDVAVQRWEQATGRKAERVE